MSVSHLGFVLLFVNNPTHSGAFYRKILNQSPVEQSPTFVLFAFPSGVMLGLWSKDTAEPAVVHAPGGSEIAFSHDDVDLLHKEWASSGISITQPPTDMDFGRTFVALDPDGHRIRVYRLHEEK